MFSDAKIRLFHDLCKLLGDCFCINRYSSQKPTYFGVVIAELATPTNT